jgi:hypothetical protein
VTSSIVCPAKGEEKERRETRERREQIREEKRERIVERRRKRRWRKTFAQNRRDKLGRDSRMMEMAACLSSAVLSPILFSSSKHSTTLSLKWLISSVSAI